MPPSASGTDSPVSPCSAILWRSSEERPTLVSQTSRKCSGAASVMKNRLTASRNASWSSVKAKSMSAPSVLRQAEHALGDDVALALVAAGVDRTGLREQESLQPVVHLGVVDQLGARAQDVHGGLVHVQVELGPENLVGTGLGANARALLQPAHGVIRGQRVGLGSHPRAQHGLAQRRVAVGLGPMTPVQFDQLPRGALVASRRAQQQPALETGGSH